MTKVLQIESKKSQTIHFFFEVISLNLADTNRIYLFKKKKKKYNLKKTYSFY